MLGDDHPRPHVATMSLEHGFQHRRRRFGLLLPREQPRKNGIGLGGLVTAKLFDVRASAIVTGTRVRFGHDGELARALWIVVLRLPEGERLARVAGEP